MGMTMRMKFNTDKTEEVIVSSKGLRQQHPVLMLEPGKVMIKRNINILAWSLTPN